MELLKRRKNRSFTLFLAITLGANYLPESLLVVGFILSIVSFGYYLYRSGEYIEAWRREL